MLQYKVNNKQTTKQSSGGRFLKPPNTILRMSVFDNYSKKIQNAIKIENVQRIETRLKSPSHTTTD